MKACLRCFAVVSLLASVGSLACAQSGTWSYTAPVAKAQSNAASTPLQNGKVLVAGGDIGGIGAAVNWAQVYDPAANTWTAAPNMKSARDSGWPCVARWWQ